MNLYQPRSVRSIQKGDFERVALRNGPVESLSVTAKKEREGKGDVQERIELLYYTN